MSTCSFLKLSGIADPWSTKGRGGRTLFDRLEIYFPEINEAEEEDDNELQVEGSDNELQEDERGVCVCACVCVCVCVCVCECVCFSCFCTIFPVRGF